MPEPNNPQVSVFHFTSRISSAKIRKYKLATERGMSAANRGSTNSRDAAMPVRDRDHSPTPKRQKRKSRAYPPKTTAPAGLGEPWVATRPKRDSTLRIRYSDNMVLTPEDRANAARGDSSELSSPEATPQVIPGPVADREPTPIDEDYGMLSTYYIMDDEVPPPPVAPKLPASITTQAPQAQFKSKLKIHPPKKPELQHPASGKTTTRLHKQPLRQSQVKLPKSQQHLPPPRAVLQHPPPPPTAPPLVPRVLIIDGDEEFDHTELQAPLPMDEMVQKIDRLSHALAEFTGVHPRPTSPKPPPDRRPFTKRNAGKRVRPTGKGTNSSRGESHSANHFQVAAVVDPVDHLLGALEDDDPDYPGRPDGNLMYGIQFIQTALKSWAQQRMQNVLAQRVAYDWQQEQLQNLQTQQQQGQPKQKGRQQQHKLDSATHRQELPAVVHMTLQNQPEGTAIVAFQEVLRSGALQVNGVLPQRMALALSGLYEQIDYLINQGARDVSPFVCMSYGAQQAAHRGRVEEWKEELATIDAISQHQYQGKQPSLGPQKDVSSFLDQCAGPIPPDGPPLPRKDQSATNIDQLSLQYLNDKHLSSYGMSVQQVATQKKGLFSRSGQQMRFSFSPDNERALDIFGPDAFPSGNPTGPAIPNRGPMGPMLPSSQIPSHMPQPMPLPPPAPATATAADVVHGAFQMPVINLEEETDEIHRTLHTTKGKPSSDSDEIIIVSTLSNFTAVNAQIVRSALRSTGSVAVHQPIGMPAPIHNTRGKGNNSRVASHYPYPGAVVLDQ